MKRFVIALAAFSMMTPVAAFAQGYHHDNGRRHVEKKVIIREKTVTPRDFHRDRHNHHRWARGRYLPREYRGRVVVYNRYHLARPERGRVWVNVGGQFLLINPHTGFVFATATPR
ncbi:MAG TPA: RcnB family protein [Pararhizobium sp.]|nr:RcnB family protein [Pararhizobium sp.]